MFADALFRGSGGHVGCPQDEISRILQGDRCRSENPKVVK
jgi:hypothetical protein